jgi:aspartate aminotransferase
LASPTRARSANTPATTPAPGAFYASPNSAGTGYSSRQLQDQLLNETGVALVSATSFGDQGERYIRFSYANSIPNTEEATLRIARFLER